jgi:hypothetical protein
MAGSAQAPAVHGRRAFAVQTTRWHKGHERRRAGLSRGMGRKGRYGLDTFILTDFQR